VPCAVGVDIGGTKIAAGLVLPDGTVEHLTRVPTPAGEAVTDAVVHLVTPLLAGREVSAVGVSVAGFVRADSRTVVLTPNISGWRPGDLAGRLQDRVGRPVVVENDANCAAWGEAVLGAGVGSSSMVCLTVGTGLGGGLVADGRLVRGSSGFAAEFGHMTVVPGGRPCSCGGAGCWEQYVSGGALVRAFQDAGGAPAQTGAGVTDAARRGDAAALTAFGVVGGRLGQGMAALTAVVDPDTFVIGGGVADAGDLLLDPVREAYAAALTPRGMPRTPARIAAATLGSTAGVVGAADLARRAGRN
jgi:glucokinase